jgi:hypothetical protein
MSPPAGSRTPSSSCCARSAARRGAQRAQIAGRGHQHQGQPRDAARHDARFLDDATAYTDVVALGQQIDRAIVQAHLDLQLRMAGGERGQQR